MRELELGSIAQRAIDPVVARGARKGNTDLLSRTSLTASGGVCKLEFFSVVLFARREFANLYVTAIHCHLNPRVDWIDEDEFA